MTLAERIGIQNRINDVQWGVYFVAAEKIHKVKIGVTNGIKRRMLTMQVDCPETLSLYAFMELSGKSEAFSLESAAHKVFNEYRYRGEWFHFTDPCKRLIKKQLDIFKKYKTVMTEQEEKANTLLELLMCSKGTEGPEEGEYSQEAVYGEDVESTEDLESSSEDELSVFHDE